MIPLAEAEKTMFCFKMPQDLKDDIRLFISVYDPQLSFFPFHFLLHFLVFLRFRGGPA